MNSRILLAVAALLLPWGALAADEVSSTQAEQARADGAQPSSPGPYGDFNKQVQERLRALGFYGGPVNGDFGPYTQAALAQFQLSVPLPASGMLDDQTLAALGLERDATASAGPSMEPAPERETGDKPAADAPPAVEASAKTQ